MSFLFKGTKIINPTVQADGTPEEILLSGGQRIYSGADTTRATVRTTVGVDGAIGSLYVSTAGKAYLKVAVAGADTDWERITTSAAD